MQKQEPKYELQYLKEAKDDYRKLDGSQRVFVDKGLDRIKVRGMDAGQPCHGNLEGCNRLKNRKLGLRIIFKQVKDSIEIITIVAIGYRRRKKVYKEAYSRLNKK